MAHGKRAYMAESTTAHCFCATCWLNEDASKFETIEEMPSSEDCSCEVCGEELYDPTQAAE